MEQKGIRTKRGDINRAIKEKNSRLKNINAEIYKIENPPRPQFIIDIENSIKAKDSPGYEHWARIFNLQQMAQTLIYIQKNDYADMQSLHSAYLDSANAHNDMAKKIPEIKKELKNLRALKEQVEIYRKTSENFKKYNAPRQIPYFKNQFYEKHEADIEAHKKARAYIYDELKLTEFPNLKKLNAKINELTETEKHLREAIPAAKEKYNTLKVISYNARMLLGYKNLEQRSIDPIAEIQRHEKNQSYAEIPVRKSTFVNAVKNGETALYFQNAYINKKCAEVIKSGIGLGRTKSENKFANDLIKTYGIERVEWVLAITVANSTSEHLSNYKKWASQKELPNEPHNFSAQSGDEIANIFLASLIRAVQLKSAEILWNSGQADNLSYEDKNAVAKIKQDKYDRENPPSAEVVTLMDKLQQKPRPIVSRPPQKQKKISYERD